MAFNATCRRTLLEELVLTNKAQSPTKSRRKEPQRAFNSRYQRAEAMHRNEATMTPYNSNSQCRSFDLQRVAAQFTSATHTSMTRTI